MMWSDAVIGFLGGSILCGLIAFIYFQRKLSLLGQEKTLYQERSNRLVEVESLLFKREDELRVQGERNAELRVALERTVKENADKITLFENIQTKWEDKFKVISSEALTLTNKSFLELAKCHP